MRVSRCDLNERKTGAIDEMNVRSEYNRMFYPKRILSLYVGLMSIGGTKVLVVGVNDIEKIRYCIHNFVEV